MPTIDDAQNAREQSVIRSVVSRYDQFKASRDGINVPLDKSEFHQLVKASIAMFVKFSYDQNIIIASRLDIRENELIAIQLEGESDKSLPCYRRFDIENMCDLEHMT